MSENTNEVYLLEAEILRLKTSLAAAQARAERAEASLAEARRLIENINCPDPACPRGAIERIWLAQPHGKRASKVIEAAIRYCEKGWKRALTSDSIREAELTGQDLRAAVDAYLAHPHGEREEGT